MIVNNIFKWFNIYCIQQGSLVQLALLRKQAQNIMSRRNHQQIQDSSQEAEEVVEHVELEEASEDPSEEEGEDLLEDPELDYQSIEKLDHYEDQGVDQEEYEVNPEARRAAEKELNRKQWDQNGLDLDVEFYMEDLNDKETKRLRAQYYAKEANEDYDEANDKIFIDAEEQKGRFDSWINIQGVRIYIRHHLSKFFSQFSINGRLIYYPLIKQMVLENKQSLYLNFQHLVAANGKLAQWLANHPINFIPQLNAALYSIVCNHFPNYKLHHSECYVRVDNLPVVDSIRKLSHENLGSLIKIQGVITTRSEVYNQLFKLSYKCYKCGAFKGPYYISKDSKPSLGSCPSCQSSGPFILEKMKSIYRNYQTLTIQQSPSRVPPGRIPRCKEVIIYGDIIDSVKPGQEVELIGIFMTRYQCALNAKQGFPVFNTFIEANYIRSIEEVHKFAKIDQESFINFSKSPNFEKHLYQSIAPSIFGHLRVKKGLTMAMFGGVAKNKDGHRTRGDINVLLLGDPGIAKSQFLKSVQKVFPKCVYTTGKGASAVGLTASVKQDRQSGQWRLQAGALVIADKGICLIDQFDKMSEADRTSIHEAMQQQTISISKAGIVTNLNARCSVIAAANPHGGRYEQSLSFNDNVHLSDPIISRFDILYVIKDKPNQDFDSRLSEFVINIHMHSHPYFSQKQENKSKLNEQHEYEEKQDYSLDFIKQYIKYAREKYKPSFTSKSSTIINKFYVKLRKYALQSGGINIAPRHLQSMIRICEAHARMHLRQETNERDAQFSINMMLRSFIETQKHSAAEKIRKNFKYQLSLEGC